MNPLICSGLLAAGMVLGQTGTPPTGNPGGVVPPPPSGVQQAQAQAPAQSQTQPQQQSRPILGWWSREDRPVLTRIQGWFKRDPKDNPKDQPASYSKDSVNRETAPPSTIPTPLTPSNDFPRKMPQPQSQGPAPRDTIVQMNGSEIQQVATKPAPAQKTPILPQFADKIGRDEKFAWITGQLEFEDGRIVLYYSTPEVIDQYHGHIILAPEQVDMKQFRKGDLVSVSGQLFQRPTAQGVVPIYRLSQANLIEHPKNSK